MTGARPEVAVVDIDMSLTDHPSKDWYSHYYGANPEALAIVRGFTATLGLGLVFISNRLRFNMARADEFLRHHNLYPDAPLVMADGLTPASITDAVRSQIGRIARHYRPTVGYAFHDDTAAVMEQAGLFVVRSPALDSVPWRS